MAYSHKFEGTTKEEALEKAESFKASLSYVTQPSIRGPYQDQSGVWVAYVDHYGHD